MKLRSLIPTSIATISLLGTNVAQAKNFNVPTPAEQAEGEVTRQIEKLLADTLEKICPGGYQFSTTVKKESYIRDKEALMSFTQPHCAGTKDGEKPPSDQVFQLSDAIAQEMADIIGRNMRCIDGRTVEAQMNSKGSKSVAISTGNCGAGDDPKVAQQAQIQGSNKLFCDAPLEAEVKTGEESVSKFIQELIS